MGTIDLLHPEELFDKAAHGLASPDELARIDAHLAQCVTCRFERLARADFDAVAVGGVNVDDLVARALSGASAVAAEPPRRRRVSGLLIAAAVALMGFGSFAAIGQFTGVLPKLIEQLSTRSREPAPEAPRAVTPVEVTPPPQVVPEPEVVAEPEAPKTVVVIERTKPRPATPVKEPVIEPTPVEPVAAPEPDALQLFTLATRERVRGETSEAIRDFRVVVARFPNSREAMLSNAALGRLLLDRGEAASALEAFDAYLATGDQVLREDVQGSRAQALQALGRADDERAAWEAVLRDYPAGVFAPRARTRLEALSP